jgi:hypothetical protein
MEEAGEARVAPRGKLDGGERHGEGSGRSLAIGDGVTLVRKR